MIRTMLELMMLVFIMLVLTSISISNYLVFKTFVIYYIPNLMNTYLE